MNDEAAVPCVRVPRTDGEKTRQALATADLLDTEHEITVDGETLYIPVVDPESVSDDYDIVHRSAEQRSSPKSPAELLGYEPSIERLGDLVILDEDDPDRAREIADAVVDSHVPARAVLNRASPIQGELRVREWDVCYVDPDAPGDRSPTETIHREYGHEFELDVASVYFSPRLATERHRVIEQIEPGEQVFDMFAGVGPFAIPAASQGATVIAVDLNETAVEYLRRNADRNGVTDRIQAIHGDVREVAAEYENWADRIVMNLPHSAEEFVETAIGLAGETCVIHYYDIQPDDDPFDAGIEAIRSAAGDEYEISVLEERAVRSYAPHEENICLDVRLDRRT